MSEPALLTMTTQARILLAAESGLRFTAQGIADLLGLPLADAQQACAALLKAGRLDLAGDCYGIAAAVWAVQEDWRLRRKREFDRAMRLRKDYSASPPPVSPPQSASGRCPAQA